MISSFEAFSKANKVGIVSHDAGGAQILSCFMANNPKNYRIAVAGPALQVFSENFGEFPNRGVKEILGDCELLLTSTGWASDWEFEAILEGVKDGIQTISVLDHWVNYRSRFIRDDREALPDAIWVSDDWALKIATREFPGKEIFEIPNYYVANQLQAIRALSEKKAANSDVKKVLFLGENISENAKKSFGNELYFGYNELSAFARFLEHSNREHDKKQELRIRLHPSESSPEKYLQLLEKGANPFIRWEISVGTLTDDLAWCDLAFGLSSYALYLASLAGKKSFSCVDSPDFVLPFPPNNIEQI